MLRLYIIAGPNTGGSYDLEAEELSLGRSPENDIQINDRSVSGRHLKLIRKGEEFFVEDLKSTNGTYVNGVLIQPGQAVEVKEGYPIAFGKTLACLDKEYTVGGTMVHHAANLRSRSLEKRIPFLYRDRPLTNPKTLQLIYKVSNALMQSFDLEQVLKKIMDYLFDCLGRIDRGAILLLDEKTGELSEIIARSRIPDDQAQIHYSRTVVGRVMRDGKAIIMPDTSHEEDADLSDSIKALKIRSVMCVPLLSRGKIRGVIYVDSRNVPHGFRKEDLYLLTGLSSPAAISIENALLYANMEKLVESRTRSFKQTEKRLRKSEGRFRAIFDNMQSGVIVYEAEKRGDDFIVLDVNRAAQEMEEIDCDRAVGKAVLEIFPGYESLGLLDVFKRVWKTGKPEHVPACYYKSDRVSGWREYDVYRLPSKEIVNIYNDVTAKMTAEEEQRILQQRLLNSQKLESIGRLAGGVAHNFRNILQAILGNVEYLEMIRSEEPEVGDTARNINNSVNKGVDLINSLLHFSRQVEETEPVVLDLADVIRDTHKILGRVLDKKININLNLAEKLYIKGNHSLLSQVFMNLFTNAKDAMPSGGVLTVEARKFKREAVVTVSDTGCGMNRETMEKIFDPFFTAKGVGEGTGLGLSTVLGIVQSHGGTITVSSKLHVGTTFEMRFPQVIPEGVLTPGRESPLIYGAGQRIMIVDDEESALDALAGLTKALGYEVRAVGKGSEALREYQEWKPDVVIMDRNMPGIDGISCIQEIVEHDAMAKVVIVSGYEQSGPDGIDEDVKGMIKGYITKPCGMQELSQTLSRVVGLENKPSNPGPLSPN
jgi:signal transduction histidine kinase/ActR/RegA family two-component response regulator